MKTIFVFLLCLSLVGCAANSYITENGKKISPVGGAYYTKVNIWYEDPEEILSTNYHKGTIIPVGSNVKIVDFGSNRISFTKEDQAGVKFTIIDVTKYSLISMKELFNNYFSKDDPRAPGGEFSKLSGREKENIEKGSLAEGMSKESAIIAYGYPPKHKTPDLVNDIWYYWSSRFHTEQVTFKDNKITKIESIRGLK
jgi:hypothetical protein